jgi:hypothetical protein
MPAGVVEHPLRLGDLSGGHHAGHALAAIREARPARSVRNEPKLEQSNQRTMAVCRSGLGRRPGIMAETEGALEK